MKYNEGFKYVHIYDNRKVETKYPGITLGHDEFLQLYDIIELMDLADDYLKNVCIYTRFTLYIYIEIERGGGESFDKS